jgi:hypothetical protein
MMANPSQCILLYSTGFIVNVFFGGCWPSWEAELVFALFLSFPYGKFVHGIYRFTALVRHAAEQRAAPAAPKSEAAGRQAA